jgi:hypothetical protein
VKIIIKRSGGLAGVEEAELARVDTSALPADAAQRAKDAVEDLLTEEPAVGTDMLRYQLELEDEEGRRRSLVVLDEGDPASPLHRLLDAVCASG